MPFLLIIWLLTLLTLNNGVFPAILQRSYVQLSSAQVTKWATFLDSFVVSHHFVHFISEVVG